MEDCHLMGYIAPYITDSEYRCPCCGGLPPDFKAKKAAYNTLFNKFASIREKWGKAIHISSGYRCLKHNTAIGGTPMSIHVFLWPLDLALPRVTDELLLEDTIEGEHPDLRRGTYTHNGTFIHIDCGYLISPRASSAWAKGARWNG
jgi:uncharacterized protein YcbK (DUF882 family)